MTNYGRTSILVRRPSCLELTAGTSATDHSNRPFQSLSKNVFIRADIALIALEDTVNGLYKFTNLLTYLLTGMGDRIGINSWCGKLVSV